MNLYLYDGHHEKVIDQFTLPNKIDLNTLTNIIEWLATNNILDKYKNLILANSYEQEYNEESGLTTVEFSF